jgi:hypothetical protein
MSASAQSAAFLSLKIGLVGRHRVISGNTKNGERNEHRIDTDDYSGAGPGWRNPSMAAQQWLGLWSKRRNRLGIVDFTDSISHG